MGSLQSLDGHAVPAGARPCILLVRLGRDVYQDSFSQTRLLFSLSWSLSSLALTLFARDLKFTSAIGCFLPFSRAAVGSLSDLTDHQVRGPPVGDCYSRVQTLIFND